MDTVKTLKQRKKWTPLRRGDLVTRLVDGREIWYFDDYIQFDRFSPARRVRKSTMCLKADYARAQEVRDEIRARLKAGDAELRRAITFSEWVPIWREKYEQEEPLAASTLQVHSQVVRPLLKFFGPKRLDLITDGDCIEYRRWRLAQPARDAHGNVRVGTTTSMNTVILDCRVASAIWKCAVRAGRIKLNPWAGVKIGTISSRTRVLTEEEQTQAVALASPQTLRFITIILGTSFRVGVLLEMPLDPVEILTTKHEQQIAVVRRMSKGKMHTQPLLPIVQQAIQEQAAWIREQRPLATRLFPFAYITVNKWLKRLAEAANIPPFTPHDIRRTFGTRSSEALNLDDTASLLNNTPLVAARHYIKQTDAAKAANKLRALRLMAPALLLPAVSSVTDMDTVGDSKI